ncbi:MAG: hypothetical protein C5S47_01070 [Candidatus Methanogasteraceae archaeon]|nr:MAG: hypothetical protein C5S47_01070 [ANME-2 cluster archaeon]
MKFDGRVRQHEIYTALIRNRSNILAFLIHTLMEFIDEKYRLLRDSLPTRKTFFDDIRALTRYMCFGSWDDMMDFMLKGLEIDIPPNQR